jgi:glucose/mannose transport system permease protein
MIEAGRVDGAGMLRTFTYLILPISIPGFVVTIIWQFTSSWNDYLFAIFLSSTRNGPITIALNALAGAQSPDYAASMAGALITSLPTLVVYVLLGRWFIGGLMAGSVKS